MTPKKFNKRIEYCDPCQRYIPEDREKEIREAIQRGKREGLLDAATVIDNWHISKGGLVALAYEIRQRANELEKENGEANDT